MLIVDEHEDTRALYTLGLSASGFDVVPAHDGRDAWRRACELRPSIILMDLPMPSGEGWRLLHALKQNPETRTIPVVAVSEEMPRSVRESAQRHGFAAFVGKSCLPAELAQGLRHLLDAQSHAHVGRQ